jgi:hypothetical protein
LTVENLGSKDEVKLEASPKSLDIALDVGILFGVLAQIAVKEHWI